MEKAKSKWVAILGIICLYWLTCPVLISVSFLTFVLLGNEISSTIAFTTMATVHILEGPMFSLPNALNEMIQILTSVKRIEKFLFANELKSDHISHTSAGTTNAIEISNGNFYWKREEQ